MEEDKPTLLVGCGINIAFNESNEIFGSSNFTYDEILPKMFQNDKDQSAVQSKFKNYYNRGGRNLEEYLRYEFVGAYASLCEDEKEATRNEFVRILEKGHHQLPILSAMNNFEIFKTNLIAFKTIYTTNYDLKLYCLMKQLDLFGTKQNSYKLFNDCFYPRDKKDKVELCSCKIHLFQDVHPNVPWNMVYLHGSLHLFSFSNANDPTDCGYKVVNATHNNLIQNRNEICRIDGFHNLIVLGGTTEEKKEIIEKNTYLTQALESLKTIEGDLVIYGCSLDANDAHIWEAISCNNIDNIYIGISGESGEENRIAKHFKGRNVSFYPHRDQNIWEKVDWFGNIKMESIKYPV